MSDAYQVKGSTILSKLDFVALRFGERARGRLEASLGGKQAFPMEEGEWYPFELYVEVLEGIADAAFGGNLSRLVEVGAFSADRAFERTYQDYVRPEGFLAFLEGMAELHGVFYNQGHIEVSIGPDGSSADVWHRDKPRFVEADLFVARGFYRRAAELHGLEHVYCDFAIKADGAHFTLLWR